ncbi:DinB family protein [Kyrpidia tusciae]|uniref:DinB family protein n=1 Tax=Kyrpidia tusciae (strain DSM 2912 / NBRC 15312 / T2) TaxID=562970 RepID=D5WTY9_KYRT2|nr:DinB family protein [Kyrpidia tusciae]ADG05309.1 DinB family protein [Kyrpidia tusciae DSM 2912]
MFATIRDFAEEWSHESAATQRVLEALTDESLARQVAPGHRTLGEIAWHLVTSVHEILSHAGLQFESLGDDRRVPDSAGTIAEAYQKTSLAALEAAQTQWSDETLRETRNMYGEPWTVAFTLRILIQHQTHHRGQMTVLMRQAGLRVPGVYGPSKEER